MYEFEVKLYYPYNSKLFVTFLMDYFRSNFVEVVNDTSYIFNENNLRYIKDFSGNIVKMQKVTLKDKKTESKKFTISKETIFPLGEEDFIIDFEKEAKTIRKRVRSIFQFPKNKLSLHLTKINDSVYEVEIERESNTNEDSDVSSFIDSFEAMMEIIQPHADNFLKFLDRFNGTLRVPLGQMSKGVISKAREFSRDDFATDKGKGIIEGYTLTVKGNGVPIMIYFKQKHVYSVTLNVNFKLLDTNINESHEEFIIIGEFFEQINMFTPFDILYWTRMPNIRNHPNHMERLENTYDIIERNKAYLSKLEIYKKDFLYVGKTPESFAKAYKKIKSQKYPFGDDGMVLTPIHTPHYTPILTGKRKLSNFPETCKVKPWHELTIDFFVNLDKKEIYTSGSTDDYTGYYKYPFDSKVNIGWNTIPPEANNKIIELFPSRSEDDNGIIILKFSRIRDDKTEPNYKKIADDNWKHINEPVIEKTLLGRDFTRLFLQNNKVKSNIIQGIPKNSIVVDIGTGKGGDIGKYNGHVKIVVCIEPCEENRKGLEERLENMKSILKTKFIVLPYGGEETDNIISKVSLIVKANPTLPLCVTSMLSMTFFWKNREMLSKFEETLKQIAILKPSNDVMFHFSTIEGNRFLKYFSENNNKIINYGIMAKYDPSDTKYGVGIPGKVTIKINNSKTVLGSQREYLVNLNDLKCLKDVKINEGVIEKYLTKEEIEYGKVTVYGIAKIDFKM